MVRNQAHGSPANILDLYALVDIPEIEGVEPLRIKMASSSGNVTGKKLVSSESATWLNEHFESNLSDMKEALDRFMLNGVNHVFYHGTSWSPEGEPWPGWLFYAAVHLNARNPMWGDFHALNKYVERCQSFLQNTSADNDVLLYYPIYDAFAVRGPKNLAHFDGIEEQFSGTSFAAVAQMLHRKGYGFDYVSDAQIRNFSVADGRIISEGKSAYRLIVVPACRFMPVETLEKIYTLASEGATVVFVDELPVSFPGLSDYDKNMDRFEKLKALLRSRISDQDGVYVQSADQILPAGVVTRETISDTGLTFIRKKQGDGTKLYFTSNPGDSLFSGWVTFQTAGKDVFLYDPMTGEFGKGERREGNGTTHVYLQLEPAQSVFVQFLQAPHLGGNFFYADEGQPIDIKGEWHLQCISGGPRLPSPLHINTLRSWTLFKDSAYSDFSGTCAYRVTFDRPRSSSRVFWLDLGQVRETASVYLNNEYIGTVIGPVYRLKIDGGRLKRKNVLEVRVSNLMANRIAYMDRNGIYWKKFYNVNMSARKPENRRNGIFDASHWMPRESGLLGPVRLIPITDRF